MDYEKKYKEALERAKQFSEKPYLEDSKGIVEYIFPELKESEDERIRKDIVFFIAANHKDDAEKAHWLYWLEKQGEKKHQYNSRPRYVGEEELLGANKQWKCPFSKQELIDKGFAFNQDGDLAYPIHKIEKKEFVEWSGEDESYLNTTIAYLKDAKEFKKTAENCIDWLKSLKDRVQPQQKQSLDEDTQQWVDAMIKDYEGWLDTDKNHKATIEAKISILKSLRPQSQWKPSEEQMEALKSSTYCQNEQMSKVLFELYQDLKKLREE